MCVTSTKSRTFCKWMGKRNTDCNNIFTKVLLYLPKTRPRKKKLYYKIKFSVQFYHFKTNVSLFKAITFLLCCFASTEENKKQQPKKKNP